MLFFSRSTLNLATIIPAIDHINKVLTTVSLNKPDPKTDEWYKDAICMACALAKQTLNDYYLLTDTLLMYRITISESECIAYHVSYFY